MIQSESAIQISKSVGDVFEFVDDTSQAPRWLQDCVEVKQTSSGPKGLGSKLHYVHVQGGRRGELDGEVTAYDKDRRLAMHYADKMFDVAIEFRFTPAGEGTQVTHSCTISPKGIMAKMMSPMVRSANQKQVAANLARLKFVMERGSIQMEAPTTLQHVVDNRVFLFGLDELYREAMKGNEAGELLPCARRVGGVLGLRPAQVPVEGYYSEHPHLEEYFRWMRALQGLGREKGPAVEHLAEFQRLHDVVTSPIFGFTHDPGKLLPPGRDSLSLALFDEAPKWMLPRLVEAAARIAEERDDFSLVGLAALVRDEVVLAALRESVVLYAEVVIGSAFRPPEPEYVWKVDEELTRRGKKFVDTFNSLFQSHLPVPSPQAAKIYWDAGSHKSIRGRCVRLGYDDQVSPILHYHWAIEVDRFGKYCVKEFWDEEIWTTARYKAKLTPRPHLLAEREAEEKAR